MLINFGRALGIGTVEALKNFEAKGFLQFLNNFIYLKVEKKKELGYQTVLKIRLKNKPFV